MTVPVHLVVNTPCLSNTSGSSRRCCHNIGVGHDGLCVPACIRITFPLPALWMYGNPVTWFYTQVVFASQNNSICETSGELDIKSRSQKVGDGGKKDL